jgi:uncharacterized protein (DUF58 family)
MAWLKAIGREALGLFVDDGVFAAGILVWLAAVWIGVAFGLAGGWAGIALFAGLAAVLLYGTLRRARG